MPMMLNADSNNEYFLLNVACPSMGYGGGIYVLTCYIITLKGID
tara:strand:- start:656 stop:787 length:132 start_codon:yes stop_codon:yes gene_type:complete